MQVHQGAPYETGAAAMLLDGTQREIGLNSTKGATLAVWLVVLLASLMGCRRDAPTAPATPAAPAAPATPAPPDSPDTAATVSTESAAATDDRSASTPEPAPETAKTPAAAPADPPAPAEPTPLPAAKPEEIPQVEHTLELTGSALGKPTVFTYTQLAQMPLSPLYDILMQKSHSPDEMTSWQGVRLAELLKAAEVKAGPLRFELKASDGFEMRSTSEVMASALLALRDGKGQWLAQLNEECPLRLVVPDKPGNYWIMNPILISVEPAE